MNLTEQQFFDDLEKKLWTAANKLLPSLDAAVYKHIVLGLLFIKYVSDAFEERQKELKAQFQDPAHDYHMNPADYPGTYDTDVAAELEVRDYYTEKNVFWVPLEARWQTLVDCAQLLPGAALPWPQPGKTEAEKMRTVGWLIDNAMEAIERENPKLKGVLNKSFATSQIESHKLAELIALFSDTNFHAAEYKGQPLSLKAKDILGHIYEYFLGQFALAEGKKGGQYYTPKAIVSLIVNMLQPFKGRVYDPAMGSGGFFVQSEEFIEQHSGKVAQGAGNKASGQISVYGQESNPTTWKLAAMNMAIRGIDFNFGPGHADTLLNDLHPDLRADYVMANPPFNMKEWWNAKLENDPRWIAGTPPQGNANFAWLQHMLYHLAPTGSMALLLANGSMSSNTNNEGEIRKRLVEDDYVECMVALPGQLFTNTQIPACIWFLTRDKANGFNLHKKKRDRRKQFLFIDARQMGHMKDRVLRDFTQADIAKIADTFHAWQQGDGYDDVKGFCASVELDDIRKHEHVLTPGRYVGAEDQEEDAEAFADKMARLTAVGKAFSLCGTLDDAVALRREIAFFSAIKAAINKFTTVDKKRSDAEKSSALKQILDNAIVADGVADIFALAGLDKPNIGLLSEEFLEDVRQMKTKNLAVELLEKLLRDEIKARARNNVVQEKKYGDRLLETLRKYHNRAVETAQVIEELIQMAKEFQAVLEREAALGLSPDEIAFYDALANNESAVRELGDDTLKKIAVEITEKLRSSTTVDWQVRESVRARLRILVRRTLQRWKYPPPGPGEEDAVELVLKQAESLSNEWSK